MPDYDHIVFYPTPTGVSRGIYALLTARTTGLIWSTFSGAAEAWNDSHLISGRYTVAMDYLGGDRYGLTVPTNLAKPESYVAEFRLPVTIGVAALADQKLPDEWEFRWSGVVSTDVAPGDSWYYSNRAGVLTVIDADTVVATWDMNNDGAEDAGLLTSDGITADGYIDLFLANEGVDVPVNLTTAPAHVVTALADVSNHMTVWYGWHHRGLQELGSRLGRSADDIAGIMSGYKTYADEQLTKIAGIINGLDEAPDRGSFESVPLTFGDESGLCDENGCAV